MSTAVPRAHLLHCGGAVALGVIPDSSLRLAAGDSLAITWDGRIAHSSGRIVHLLDGGHICCSWQLPTVVLSLQWWPGCEDCVIFAITEDGAGWRLDRSAYTPEALDAEGPGSKRLRATVEITNSRLIWVVGNTNRVQLSSLSPIETVTYGPQACCALTAVPCMLPFCARAQYLTTGQSVESRALHKLQCGADGCALRVVGNGEAIRAGVLGAPIQPALFDALIGGKGVALLVSDATGGVFAQQQQPVSPASLVLQLGEPLAALLLAPHAVDAACQPCESGADTVVAVGRYGRVLLLNATDGGLCQRLWQLHTATRVTAACVVGRTLLFASLEGALAARLPLPIETTATTAATDVASFGATPLWCRGPCQGKAKHKLWRCRHVSIPTMAAELLPFGSVPLCLQPLPFAPPDAGAPAAASAASATAVVALFADGVLALLRPASASLGTTGVTATVAAGFVGEYFEQRVRQQLQLIRVDSERLAAARATLMRADGRLGGLAKACRAMRMVHASCDIYLLILAGAKAPRLQVQLRNTAKLGTGWGIYAQLRHAPPLAMDQGAVSSDGAKPDNGTLPSCCSSCNAPLHDLSAGGAWANELPLVLPALHAHATMLFSLGFRLAANIVTPACAFLCAQPIALHHLLRSRGSYPTANCLNLGFSGALVTLLGALEAPTADAVHTATMPGYGSSPPGRQPLACDTRCKLRLLSTAELRVVLETLLDGDAPGARGSADVGRQEVGSTKVSLYLERELQRANGDIRRAWGLLVQTNQPGMWALRAALLRHLVPQRAPACSGRLRTLPVLPALLVQQLQLHGQVQEPQLQAARVELDSALQEVGVLHPFLRQQEHKLLQLHDTMLRLHEMRRLHHGQGGRSLFSLSGEARRACHVAIEVHQVTRNHFGCLPLCV